jgi:hypothetical protein
MNELIDPRTLRIGNLLEYDGKVVHVTMLSLDIDDEYQDTIGFCAIGQTSHEKSDWNRALVDKLDRIPLTHEWLVKLGFEYDAQHESFPIFHTQSEGGIEFFDEQVQFVGREMAEPIEHIKYVHQLQNLYYALTGEELTIKKGYE